MQDAPLTPQPSPPRSSGTGPAAGAMPPTPLASAMRPPPLQSNHIQDDAIATPTKHQQLDDDEDDVDDGVDDDEMDENDDGRTTQGSRQQAAATDAGDERIDLSADEAGGTSEGRAGADDDEYDVQDDDMIIDEGEDPARIRRSGRTGRGRGRAQQPWMRAPGGAGPRPGSSKASSRGHRQGGSSGSRVYTGRTGGPRSGGGGDGIDSTFASMMGSHVGEGTKIIDVDYEGRLTFDPFMDMLNAQRNMRQQQQKQQQQQQQHQSSVPQSSDTAPAAHDTKAPPATTA
ncbi:hypothetical protein OIO90_005087 [Microbotryomycetes sp. JL221]|nr:hypothetical protein OIO90_005087 [Microbotryomycetes sp. JL221]